MKRTVLVYTSWASLPQSQFIGTLSAGYLKGKEHFSFYYDEKWLKQKSLPAFDPDLPPVSGHSFPSSGKIQFGIFSDASPDRWGRTLMMRREKFLAKASSRPEKTLMEIDFLLGVDDSGRMGALRFKENADGPFLADDQLNPAPPMTELRKLEAAAIALEEGRTNKMDEAVALLFRPGSSLGGARPKANVAAPDGSLWIAKFPSENDAIDVGAWEEVTATLAKASGITMAESKALKLGSKHHTFVTKRFDRLGAHGRRLYASAMTLLGRSDGQSSEASYLELAEILIAQGCSPKAQLEELWKRIVFSILVANTDDHLRNHGFLYNFELGGWDLSPAFDINPSLSGAGLSLAIDESDHSLELATAIAVAPFFKITMKEADRFIQQLLQVRASWRRIAKKIGIKASEIELMAKVFEADR